MIFVFLILGVAWSLVRRIRLYPYKRFWRIVNNDYYFSEYATIALLSFVYTLYQGLSYGIGAWFLFLKFTMGIAKVNQKYSWCESMGIVRCETGNEYFLYALAAVGSVVIVRILIEGYLLVFKVGQVFIDRFEYDINEEMLDDLN